MAKQPTTPATPATSVVAPATPRTPAVAPIPSEGEMNFLLTKLANPLLLKQVVRDRNWDKFKTIMVIIGGILVLWTLAYWSYRWGNHDGQSVPAPAAVHQPITVPAPQPQPQQVQPLPARELTPEELDRRYSEYLLNRDR